MDWQLPSQGSGCRRRGVHAPLFRGDRFDLPPSGLHVPLQRRSRGRAKNELGIRIIRLLHRLTFCEGTANGNTSGIDGPGNGYQAMGVESEF